MVLLDVLISLLIFVAGIGVAEAFRRWRERSVLREVSKRSMIEKRTQEFISDSQEYFLPVAQRAGSLHYAVKHEPEPSKLVFYRLARYLHEDRRLAEALGGVYFPGGTQTEKEVVDARKNLRTCVAILFGEKADFIENVIGYYRRHQSYGSFVKALGKLSKEYKTFEKNIEGVKRDLSKSSLKLANLIAKAITRIYEDWYDVYKT